MLGESVSDFPHFDPPGLCGQFFAELMATGAVLSAARRSTTPVTGAGTITGADLCADAQNPPSPQNGWVHFVPDAATAMREAKAAGETLKEVSARLGHSSIVVTADV